MVELYDYRLLWQSIKFVIPILTFLSLVKVVLYYSLFNIEIGSFISLEELVTPFVKDILVYALILILPFVILGMFVAPFVGKVNVENFKKQKNSTFFQRLSEDFKKDRWFIFFQIVFLVLAFALPNGSNLGLQVLFISPVASFIFWLRREILILHDFEFTLRNVTFYNLSSIFIILVIFLVYDTYSEATLLKKGNGKQVQILLTNEAVNCGGEIQYVGRMKNYTFIYNINSKQSTVLDNSEIKKIIFSNN
ncbi:hypothetical protein [Daejeonella sp. JGW-45]|uniref:hypothetical protein n=1 Tax=Daejeonella sp. JGW-45 TaxID=3034148 RepID=UPI0023ECD15E|nr:hypothetical protein [Daejeonella sp. JGW-45]